MLHKILCRLNKHYEIVSEVLINFTKFDVKIFTLGNKNINPNLLKGAFAQKEKSVDALSSGILSGDRAALSEGITLIESSAHADREKATALLNALSPDYVRSTSWRIAISGSPGVGKSTFIEALIKRRPQGKYAVLTIDPSSEETKGSILGDKTRMEESSVMDNVFVRPSPSKSFLGGVSSKTREVMLLCEAAGYDHILIETVGVGQSETMVSQMVDLFVLLVLPGSGDEIQGIKRGIVELADIITITKSDGDRQLIAKQSARAYKNALHILSGKYKDKTIPTLAISSTEGKGLEDMWKEISKFKTYLQKENLKEQRRKNQVSMWYNNQLKDVIYEKFISDPKVQDLLNRHRKEIENGAVDVWRLLGSMG